MKKNRLHYVGLSIPHLEISQICAKIGCDVSDRHAILQWVWASIEQAHRSPDALAPYLPEACKRSKAVSYTRQTVGLSQEIGEKLEFLARRFAPANRSSLVRACVSLALNGKKPLSLDHIVIHISRICATVETNRAAREQARVVFEDTSRTDHSPIDETLEPIARLARLVGVTDPWDVLVTACRLARKGQTPQTTATS